MTKKLFAVVLLSFGLAACESGPTENNSNTNTNARANAPSQVASPTPAASLTPETSPSVKPQVKVGDKVKVRIDGALKDASVVSVDEKSGKVNVKVQGQKEEKTVAIIEIVKP